jgi:antitoxin (DNA-binding transcriptional repressor) of toxin-antitoxin stability system
MAKNVIHISEAEAANDFAGVLARVRAGAEIVIEGSDPIVVIRAGEVHAGPVRSRLLSESIALAKAHEEETGKIPVLDPDFAADLEDIIKSRKPREISY